MTRFERFCRHAFFAFLTSLSVGMAVCGVCVAVLAMREYGLGLAALGSFMALVGLALGFCAVCWWMVPDADR